MQNYEEIKEEMERRGQIIVHLLKVNRELYDELEEKTQALAKLIQPTIVHDRVATTPPTGLDSRHD